MQKIESLPSLSRSSLFSEISVGTSSGPRIVSAATSVGILMNIGVIGGAVHVLSRIAS
jgi:hypothetical protein